MARIERIADDLLCIADLVPVDGRISWHDPMGEGFEPHNEYVLLGSDRALIVDTGHAAHGPSLAAALKEILGGRALFVLLTRSELDSLGNLPLLIETFTDVRVLTTSSLPPTGLVHIRGRSRADVPVHYLETGVALESLGFGRLTALNPVIKLLGTCWAYDAPTDTLFSADFFGAALMRTPNDAILLRDAHGLPSREAIKRTMLAKFSWLARAEIHEVLAIWDRVFATLRPKIIAPKHGRPIVGEELAAKTIADYRAAIAMCGESRRA